MINLSCSGCGQKVEVPSLIAAARQACPHCGRAIIGGAPMPPPAPRPAEGDAAAVPPAAPDPLTPVAPDAKGDLATRALAISIAAILNYVMGGLNLLGGCCVLFLADMLANWQEMRTAVERQSSAAEVTLAGRMLAIMGVVSLFMAGLQLSAGHGLRKRLRWARILALVVAGIEGFSGLFTLWLGVNVAAISSTLLHLGFAAAIFYILLNENYAADFR